MIKKLLVIAAFSLFSTGCVSHYAYKSNHKAVERLKVYETGDQKLIQAYNNGDVVGVGIDLTAVDVIFNSPATFFKQLGAGIIDAGLIYGASEAVDSINSERSSEDNSGSRNTIQSGGDTFIITNVNGNGNDQSADKTDDSEFINE